MKRFGIIMTCILIGSSIFLLGFNYKNLSEPNAYYQVYLDDEVIGVVKSKKALERYIDKEGDQIKRKYGVDVVYAPEGLEIKKITTYDQKLDSVRSIYNKIKEQRPFTIKGYQVTIRQTVASTEGENETKEKINKYYVLKEEIFSQAAEETVKIFVGEEQYEAYKTDSQIPIDTTGSIITDVYIDGDKTIKETKIPVTEDIYISAEDLTHDLVFGKDSATKKYVVQMGDTIEKIAFNNQISIGEFLISNPEFTNENSLLYPNQEVVIGITDPQLSVVKIVYSVEDHESNYGQEIVKDDNMMIGEEFVETKGEKGLDRVSQNMKYVNGEINYIEPKGKEVLKVPINEVIRRGTHYIPHVGSLTSWQWPTQSGWTITSYYAWRINPINGKRELHDAIDIAGTGYGSPLYAANNGTVEVASYTDMNGNYVIINHNNGYYTYYGHMSKILVQKGQTVARGSTIGKVGDTGWATGPHVHFGIWSGFPYRGGSRSHNPLNFY